MPPKYIVKTLANGSATAACDIFYDKQTLCSELQDSMNKYDLIVQQFISQKTLQACIYRFYRNEKNVYKAKIFINKTSVGNDPSVNQVYSDLLLETQEECMHSAGGHPTPGEVTRPTTRLESAVGPRRETAA